MGQERHERMRKKRKIERKQRERESECVRERMSGMNE